MREEMVEVPGATLWTASQGAGVPLVLCHGAELAPLGRYVELERSAHSPWLEQPGDLRRALRGFGSTV